MQLDTSGHTLKAESLVVVPYWLWSILACILRSKKVLTSLIHSELKQRQTEGLGRNRSWIQVWSFDTSADKIWSRWNEKQAILLLFISHTFYKALANISTPLPCHFPTLNTFWALNYSDFKSSHCYSGPQTCKICLVQPWRATREGEVGKDSAGCHQSMSFFTHEGRPFVFSGWNTITHSWEAPVWQSNVFTFCQSCVCACLWQEHTRWNQPSCFPSPTVSSFIPSFPCFPGLSLWSHEGPPCLGGEKKKMRLTFVPRTWDGSAVACSAAALSFVSPVRSISVSEEEGRRVASLCPLSPSFVSIPWSQFSPSFFHPLSSTPLLICHLLFFSFPTPAPYIFSFHFFLSPMLHICHFLSRLFDCLRPSNISLPSFCCLSECTGRTERRCRVSVVMTGGQCPGSAIPASELTTTNVML